MKIGVSVFFPNQSDFSRAASPRRTNTIPSERSELSMKSDLCQRRFFRRRVEQDTVAIGAASGLLPEIRVFRSGYGNASPNSEEDVSIDCH